MFAKLVKKADGTQELTIRADLPEGATLFMPVDAKQVGALKRVFTQAAKSEARYAYLNAKLANGRVVIKSKNAYFAKAVKAMALQPAKAKPAAKPASKKASKKKAAPKAQPALVQANMDPRQQFALELCSEFGWSVQA